MKTLRNILAGAVMGATALFAPIKSHAEELMIFPVEMIYDYGEKKQEHLMIGAFLDKETNLLGFVYYTGNFNKEDWTKEEQMIPLPARYTNINHNFTRLFILHPKEVKISDIRQEAYLVPQHEGVELKPLEESPKAQAVLKAGEKLVDWMLSFTKIPFADKLFDKFVEYCREKSKKDYQEMFKKINEDYTATQIPSFPVDKFGGFTETARAYAIYFDMSEAPKGEVPMSLWIKIALGDPSMASHGSFPNKYGELENMINFSLMGEKEEREPQATGSSRNILFESGRDGNLEIYVMNADGTNQRNLTNNSADDGHYGSPPQWSPDGSKIAFVSDRDGNLEIYVMNADGTNQRNLTNNSAWDWYPQWSPVPIPE